MEAWVYLSSQLTSGLHYPVGSLLWDMNEEIMPRLGKLHKDSNWMP